MEEHKLAEINALQEAIHNLLVLGVGISSGLMLLGLLLDFLLNRPVPESVPPLAEVFQRLLALRPSGFLALGLLVLIATPIVRVFGSLVAFVYERDWRYAAVTFVVFMIVITSIVLGQG